MIIFLCYMALLSHIVTPLWQTCCTKEREWEIAGWIGHSKNSVHSALIINVENDIQTLSFGGVVVYGLLPSVWVFCKQKSTWNVLPERCVKLQNIHLECVLLSMRSSAQSLCIITSNIIVWRVYLVYIELSSWLMLCPITTTNSCLLGWSYYCLCCLHGITIIPILIALSDRLKDESHGGELIDFSKPARFMTKINFLDS